MKILYFGPIAEEGKPAVGGYEAANRKNIDELRRNGIEVIEFPNPVIKKRFGKLGKIAYFKLFLTPLLLYKYRNENVILHITPLYRNLATPAVFTEWIAQKLNIPVLLDIRAGSFIDLYENHGKRQRRIMRKLLSYANRVTVEGKSYIEDIRKVANYKGVIDYFPNVVDCSSLEYLRRDKEDKINIFYFGRITKNKGIDIMEEVISLLDNRFHLFLAGNIAGDVNKEKLLNDDKITYLGLLSPSQLKEKMRKMHFFLFPTRHPGEGQSNSLIEAMSEGLIPIVADQGFCAEVVGSCGKVIKQGCNATYYVEAINEMASEDIDKIGISCIEHIRNCHNLKKEIEKLIIIYKELCNH